MHRECFDHAERKGGAADTAAGQAKRGRTAIMERPVELFALGIAQHADAMNLLGFRAQRCFGIEEFGY